MPVRMGAGILPVTIFKNTMFFMLGKEHKNNYWCDFGGSTMFKETQFETAIREGYEELDGLLGNQKELKKLINQNYINTLNTADCRYTTFIFLLDYNKAKNLEFYFNNHRKFLVNNNLIVEKNGFFEKSEIKLFSKYDLLSKRENIRPYYNEIVEQLLHL